MASFRRLMKRSRADDVEEAVERFYETIQLEPERINKLRQRLSHELAEVRRVREREAKRQKTRVERLVGEQDKLMKALYAGIPIERFKQEQARIAREMADAKVVLEGSQAKFDKSRRRSSRHWRSPPICMTCTDGRHHRYGVSSTRGYSRASG